MTRLPVRRPKLLFKKKQVFGSFGVGDEKKGSPARSAGEGRPSPKHCPPSNKGAWRVSKLRANTYPDPRPFNGPGEGRAVKIFLYIFIELSLV